MGSRTFFVSVVRACSAPSLLTAAQARAIARNDAIVSVLTSTGYGPAEVAAISLAGTTGLLIVTGGN